TSPTTAIEPFDANGGPGDCGAVGLGLEVFADGVATVSNVAVGTAATREAGGRPGGAGEVADPVSAGRTQTAPTTMTITTSSSAIAPIARPGETLLAEGVAGGRG